MRRHFQLLKMQDLRTNILQKSPRTLQMHPTREVNSTPPTANAAAISQASQDL